MLAGRRGIGRPSQHPAFRILHLTQPLRLALYLHLILLLVLGLTVAVLLWAELHWAAITAVLILSGLTSRLPSLQLTGPIFLTLPLPGGYPPVSGGPVPPPFSPLLQPRVCRGFRGRLN